MKKIFTVILSVTISCLMFGQYQVDGVITYDESNEIIERRGLHEKHYLRSDGNVDMMVSSEPLHYLENNKWETIDSRITDNSSNDFVGYEYANTKNSFKSYYSSDINKGFVTSFKDGSVIQEFQDVKMYYMDAAENISGIQSISSSSKFKLSDNAITHQDIFLSTDVNITQQNGKRKLDFVLKDITAVGNAPSDAKFLVFEETTILPDGFNATLENQSIVIEDANGNFVAQYDAPMAYGVGEEISSKSDVSNNSTEALDYEPFDPSEHIINEEIDTMNEVRYDIFQTVDNKLIIKTIVDMELLNQNESSYPIVIDPTLSNSRGQTGWHYSNGGGPSPISTSGAPLNSYITNVNVSFSNIRTQYRYWNWGWQWSNDYSGNCYNWHVFSLADDSSIPGSNGLNYYVCGGNYSTWNCRNPNNNWQTRIYSYDGYRYRGRWAYTVNVTYSTFSNDFGVNEWKVYAYEGRDRYLNNVSYKGVYTEPNLSYSTLNRWPDLGSPSDASGYVGCGVGDDYHTVVSKRRGFPAGYYSIDVNTHDDEIVLFVNGTQVYENGGCCAFRCGVWNGYLDANSTVEFRHAEGVGGSNQGLNFIPILNYGVNSWNIYGFDGRNRDNLSATSYKGFYTRNTIGVNTFSDYGYSAPDAASGWNGCGSPGDDNHTVVAMRKGFPCGTYSLEVAGHDDEASLVVDGTVVWTANCCNFNGVKWTGVLDANSTVEMRYAEGGGGHGMRLIVNNISSSLNAGIIAYGGANNACSGYNPPTISSSTSASGGSSASVNNGSTSYQWTLNGSNISGATGATYDPGTLIPGTYSYRRVATDKCGNSANSNEITITVTADPTASISGGSTTSGCVGLNPTTLTGTVNDASGTDTYQWTLNGSNISGATSTTYDPPVLNSPGTYTYRLVHSSSGSNCDAATSAPITFTVTPTATAGTVSAGTTPQCVGSTTTYTVSGVELGGGTGTWSSSNTGVATVDASTGVVTAVGAGTCNIIYTVTGGCGGTKTANASYSVDASPFAANAGEDKPACINNSATLSASNPPVGSGTWTWSPSAPTYAGGTTANDYNAQVTFGAAGSYTGTWTVTNGACTSSADNAVVTVSSANNNASLFSSAGAAAETVSAFEVCEEGAWTYYAASGTPDEYLFAINKNGNSFSAVVSITDLPGTTAISSLGGAPAIRGTWLIGRYWNVSLLSGSLSTTVDVRFFVDPAEVTQAQSEATAFLNNTAAATNMTALTFFKTVSTAFDPATDLVNGEFTFAPIYLSPHTTGTLNGVTYYELTGLTSFSGGTGGFSVNDNNASLLPVELLSFDVNAVDNQFIRLDWATASEINNEGFEVLRSTDGVNFERIAWIGGNGNSTEINEYVFNDRGVDKGMTYYYQLKQIDYDGQYEYFDIKSARLDGSTTFSVGALVPNPSKGSETVSVDIQTSSGDVLTVEIYDRIGSKVKSASYVLFAADNALDINISDLAAGTYFLKFDSSMGTETKKLVVVK